MAKKSAKVAAATGLAAIALSSGAALAWAQDATQPADQTQTQTQYQNGQNRQGMKGMKGMRGGMGGAELATKLGVTEDQLQQALETVHQNETKPGDGQTPPTQEQMDAHRQQEAQALADALGIDVSKVTTAMDELRTERQAQERTDMSSRLDQAVTDGKLTSSDKDSVLKAFDAGVLGGGKGGPGMGGGMGGRH